MFYQFTKTRLWCISLWWWIAQPQKVAVYQFIKHDFCADRTWHWEKSCFISFTFKNKVVKVVFYNSPVYSTQYFWVIHPLWLFVSCFLKSNHTQIYQSKLRKQYLFSRNTIFFLCTIFVNGNEPVCQKKSFQSKSASLNLFGSFESFESLKIYLNRDFNQDDAGWNETTYLMFS